MTPCGPATLRRLDPARLPAHRACSRVRAARPTGRVRWPSCGYAGRPVPLVAAVSRLSRLLPVPRERRERSAGRQRAWRYCRQASQIAPDRHIPGSAVRRTKPPHRQGACCMPPCRMHTRIGTRGARSGVLVAASSIPRPPRTSTRTLPQNRSKSADSLRVTLPQGEVARSLRIGLVHIPSMNLPGTAQRSAALTLREQSGRWTLSPGPEC
jgi:hypothetical protein